MNKEQEQFDKLIQEKVSAFKTPKLLILEISRVTYYLTQLNSKLWQDVNDEAKEKKATTSQENLKPQEAE